MATPFNDYIGFMNLREEGLKPASGVGGVAPGKYGFEVLSSETGESKNGNPTLKIRARVIDALPELQNQLGQEQNATYTLLATSDYSRRRLLNLLMACGVPVDEKGGFSAKALEGTKFTGVVIEEKDNTPGDDGQPTGRTFRKISGEEPFKAFPSTVANGSKSKGGASAQV